MSEICTILGTHPEIIKMLPVARACERRGAGYFMIHTGQHYSYNMDRVFFEQIGLPDARYNLDVGSGSGGHGEQTERTWWVNINSNKDIKQDYGDVEV